MPMSPGSAADRTRPSLRHFRGDLCTSCGRASGPCHGAGSGEALRDCVMDTYQPSPCAGPSQRIRRVMAV